VHRLKLVRKLQAQMAAPPEAVDLAKAARLLTDIKCVALGMCAAGLWC